VDKDKLRDMLKRVKSGSIGIDDAMESLKTLPFEDIGYAMVDTHRALRKGYPEVIFCQSKTPRQVAGIVATMKEHHCTIMATRASREVYDALTEDGHQPEYFEEARIALVGKPMEPASGKTILVVTAGTSDIPVAEEAAVTATVLGNRVERLFDIGVAGIHRLFGNIQRIHDASVVVAVAGMDGVLPSIIGGLVDRPVIAVPTSVGYGASFNGLSALLTMLNSCAPGISVVNIDNGFGAGYLASMINRTGE
jgi:pyridinium-3,5-biscarboxylic acid mononucleotide synthase